MKKLLFIKTGFAIKGIPPELLDFEHWTAAASGRELAEWHTVPVIEGEKLPDVRDYAGVVVSGSAAMVSDRHAWSEYTGEWLVKAMDHQVPILGICYGHQLLAHALGGTVDYHPNGREMGTKQIHLTPSAQQDELFKNLPQRFAAHTTHMQSVTRLPAGTEVLALNPFEPHHGVRFAPRVWGVQFHPEFTTTAMSHYLRIRGDALKQEGFDLEQLHAEVVETSESEQLLRRFVRLAD